MGAQLGPAVVVIAVHSGYIPPAGFTELGQVSLQHLSLIHISLGLGPQGLREGCELRDAKPFPADIRGEAADPDSLLDVLFRVQAGQGGGCLLYTSRCG